MTATATATQTTTNRPVRTLSYNRLAGCLWIRQGSKPEVGYYLDKIPCTLGNAVAARLTKIIPPTTADEPREYAVILSPGCDQCECKGFLRHGRCKHVAALRCLAERGSL